MADNRISKDQLWINVAEEMSKRSTCDRLAVGAILTDSNGEDVIGSGYNGAPIGMGHCSEHGHMIVNNHCVRVVHAEVNAIISAARHGGNSTIGTTLYCNYKPCWECFKQIINARISKVVYKYIYKSVDPNVDVAAQKSGILLASIDTDIYGKQDNDTNEKKSLE